MLAKENKQKLTLSIDKEVIKSAKQEGINISQITEQILKAITFSADENTTDDVISAYKNFFDVIQPFLKKYRANIQVGNDYDLQHGIDFPIRLGGSYLVKDYPDDSTGNVTVESEIDSLYSPKEIIERLIPALIKGAKNNREKLKEFEMALRFLRAMSNEDDENEK